MDNQYICTFICSKDIATYLQEINYEFTPLQYAYLIWQNHVLTIEQKHGEWRKLICNTADIPVLQGKRHGGFNSMHRMLEDYIQLEKEILETFQRVEKNAVYTGRWYEMERWNGGGRFFETYEECFHETASDASNENCRFEISKLYIDHMDKESRRIHVYFNPKGEITQIETSRSFLWEMNKEKEKLWLYSFEEMWFDFPIPFKVGDIVCDCYTRKPFVLKGTVPWYKKENPPIQKEWMDFMTHIDMNASGYTYNSDMLSLSDECSGNFQYLNL